MNNDSSAKIKELTKKAELFGLHKNNQLPESNAKILDSADRAKRLLSTEELNILCERSHSDASKLEELQNILPRLIDEAKDVLLRRFPEIIEPGGSLYPEERAEACWRDCFHFARISIYGTAAGNTDITDKEGVKAVQELYSILEVPVNALMICLKELQVKCREIYSESTQQKDLELLDGCFNHLVATMESMK
uniref:Allophycocyanin-like protein n=1 Tax=uncultured Synechococcus sp. TaxID=154535 RepID=A0A024CJ82_9SYNE|nr:allophycocyanin-like protein [uncultured Synechococcus sp.]